jgi:hypothetical protein
MDLAAECAARGYPEGTVVFALEQTAGRGRFGTRWWSPPGAGLLFSVALWPRRAHAPAALLTFMGAVAVAETLRRLYRMDARIRWPNDVVVAGRKIAGVLVETKPTSRLKPLAILGIGVNLRTKREQMPPELASRPRPLVSAPSGEGRGTSHPDVEPPLLDPGPARDLEGRREDLQRQGGAHYLHRADRRPPSHRRRARLQRRARAPALGGGLTLAEATPKKNPGFFKKPGFSFHARPVEAGLP